MYVVGQEVAFKSVIGFNHEMHKLKTRTGARIKTILPHAEEAPISLLRSVSLKHTQTQGYTIMYTHEHTPFSLLICIISLMTGLAVCLNHSRARARVPVALLTWSVSRLPITKSAVIPIPFCLSALHHFTRHHPIRSHGLFSHPSIPKI